MEYKSKMLFYSLLFITLLIIPTVNINIASGDKNDTRGKYYYDGGTELNRNEKENTQKNNIEDSSSSKPSKKCKTNRDDIEDNAYNTIGEIISILELQNVERLSLYLSDDFKYGCGDTLSKEQTLEMLKKHPNLMKGMANIIKMGCKKDLIDNYLCPPTILDHSVIYFGSFAIFTKQIDGDCVWKLAFFGNICA